MTNRKIGNDFEHELCEILFQHGFWVHNLKQDNSGQPADIIAVRNKVAYLIDAKVCSLGGFTLSRMEENQELAMSLWKDCGNGYGWFALKVPTGEIYMLNHICVKAYGQRQSVLSFSEIHELGKSFEVWVKKCK